MHGGAAPFGHLGYDQMPYCAPPMDSARMLMCPLGSIFLVLKYPLMRYSRPGEDLVPLRHKPAGAYWALAVQRVLACAGGLVCGDAVAVFYISVAQPILEGWVPEKVL